MAVELIEFINMDVAKLSEHGMVLNIPNISRLDTILSPVMLIYGIPWKVEICKYETAGDDEPSLGVLLHCANQDASSDWEIAGLATFKLLPFSADAPPARYNITPTVFDSKADIIGESEFIRWNDLFDTAKQYVKNDTINLEVKVKAEDPTSPNRSRLLFDCKQCCENGKSTTVNLMITNIDNLMAVRTPRFRLRGLPWFIQITKNHHSQLGVSAEFGEIIPNVSCKMAMSIKLVSSKIGVFPIEKCDIHQYNCSMDLNVVEVVSWKELIKEENGFVNNDSIMLKIELNSDKPKCDDADDAPAEKRSKLNQTGKTRLLKLRCPICGERIESQQLAFTSCGHLFCFSCIQQSIIKHATCPKCSKMVDLDHVQRFLPM